VAFTKVLTRSFREPPFSSLLLCKDTARSPSPDTKSNGTLILTFLVYKMMRNKFLFSIKIIYFIIAAEQTKTNYK
jgi:hypothetical protein